MTTPGSTAAYAAFLFAQQTDRGNCHLSFSMATDSGGHPVNLQISMDAAAELAENLVRVLSADRLRERNKKCVHDMAKNFLEGPTV